MVVLHYIVLSLQAFIGCFLLYLCTLDYFEQTCVHRLLY